MNYEILCQNMMQFLKDCINSKEFLSSFCEPCHFTRCRKLTQKQVVLFLLHASKRCLYLKMDSLIQQFPTLKFPDISKQALSKARLKLQPELFQTLFQQSVLRFYEHRNETGNWHGYHLFAIDGSKVMVPNTKQNQTFFGYASNKKARITTTMGAVSLLYDIEHDILADASVAAFLSSEVTAAERHLDFLEQKRLSNRAVILCDRGYASYDFFRRIQEAGYFFIMRLQKNVTSLTCLASEDAITEYLPIHLKKTSAPKLKVRVLRITLDTGSTEWLATNLFDPSLTAEEFKEVYFRRWKIESKYLELKSQLELEEFTGCHPISIQQDFFINLLLSNLGALVKKIADNKIDEETRKKKNKHQYQTKRSCILGNLKGMLLRICLNLKTIETELKELVERSAKRRSQLQPNRKKERPRVQLQRHHFNNRKTCM